MYVSPLLVQAACMCIACIARISAVLLVLPSHVHQVTASWQWCQYVSCFCWITISNLPSLFLLPLTQRSNTMDSPVTSSHGPFLQGSVSSFRKLSNFFGEEPPRLEDLESFLERLGYSHLTQVGGVAGHVTAHVITQLYLIPMKLIR